MHDTFFKFPRTPHLYWLGKERPRDDKVLAPDVALDFLQKQLIVEEKVDGANIGISLDATGNIRVQNRGGFVDAYSHPQFGTLQSWLGKHRLALIPILATGLIMFGEWCYAKHSIYYDALPDWFLLFDVYDSKSSEFWSVSRRNQVASDLGLFCIPILAKGRFAKSDLLQMMKKSIYGNGLMEGIYLRAEKEGRLLSRAKLVQPGFSSAIGVHWSKTAMTKNTLGAV